jgi:GNAT superfamily N-acetyltransferase
MSHLVIRARADSPNLRKAACSIEQAAWNELGYLNYTRAHYELYANLLDHYADYQLCLVDEERGYPVAVANCVPIRCSGPDELPPEGWDWVVERAEQTRQRGNPNCLGALAISVPSIYRAKGYARRMIQGLLDLAAKEGFAGLVAPVRPSAKAQHPRVRIEDYITWTDERGRVFDPWLRSHLSSGGKLIGPCERSMVVDEHIGFWENWTHQRFEASGSYDLEGALVPVNIDLDRQTGRYEEPNVWVAYAVGSA